VIKRKTSLRDKILSRKVAGKKQVPKALVEAVAEMERLYKDFAGTKNDKAVSIKLAGLLGVSPLDLEEMPADEFDEWVRSYIESNRAAAIETPHPYKLYLAEYCQQHPSVKHPKSAAAKAYWATKLDKNERIKYADEIAFVRRFKRYCSK
jgi:hypothetical protein